MGDFSALVFEQIYLAQAGAGNLPNPTFVKEELQRLWNFPPFCTKRGKTTQYQPKLLQNKKRTIDWLASQWYSRSLPMTQSDWYPGDYKMKISDFDHQLNKLNMS